MKSQVAAYFDRIATDFDSYYEEPRNGFQALTNRFLRKPSILKRLRLALEALDHPEYKTILDIGCGSGVLAIPLAQRGHKVLGIDFAEPMIEISKRKTKEAGVIIEFRVADFMRDDFPKVDACVALGVLEYFKNPSGFIEKMLSLVHSGGVVVFDLPALFNVHTPLRLPYLLWRKAKAYFYTHRNAQKLLEPFRNDLASSHFKNYGAGYLVILKKK